LGWSGGNNVGIRAALADGCVHVLLLNNDATIRPHALEPLVEAAQDPRVGAVGSLIVSDRDPTWVEFGGTYIEERTRHPRQKHGRLAEMTLPNRPVPTPAVKGCSMLLTHTGLTTVGLLGEEYFLNYDETDWCYRATGAGLVNVLACRSIVAHKGAVSFDGTEGPLYRYFVTRNRLLFARRHLDRVGRIHAWRSAFWEFRQSLSARRSWRQRAYLTIASGRAVFDYCIGRFGDCPRMIRVVNRRFRDA
jgi:GT2 family glycosyltransferase